MATELAFALINPYTIAKSRTGGVIGRLISRTGLDLVAARMFGPSVELVERYAESLLANNQPDPDVARMLAEYVRKNYAPDPATGRRHRVILLLFEGENAIQKIREATGHLRAGWCGGETIRDTYGDFVVDENNVVRYFEPAILVANSVERAASVLRLGSGSLRLPESPIVEVQADRAAEFGIQWQALDALAADPEHMFWFEYNFLFVLAAGGRPEKDALGDHTPAGYRQRARFYGVSETTRLRYAVLVARYLCLLCRTCGIVPAENAAAAERRLDGYRCMQDFLDDIALRR